MEGLNADEVGGKAGRCLVSAGLGRFGPNPNLLARCCRLGSGLGLKGPACPDWSRPDWSRLIVPVPTPGGEIDDVIASLVPHGTGEDSGAPWFNPTAAIAGLVSAWIWDCRSLWGKAGFTCPPEMGFRKNLGNLGKFEKVNPGPVRIPGPGSRFDPVRLPIPVWD